jgi:GT2 family glycosyltransferase
VIAAPPVAVIVLNFNGRRWLESCLTALAATDYPNFWITVVDNASDDGSVDLVRERFPKIEVIVNPTNLGFCEGNNVGIGRSLEGGAAYVVLLNPDTKVEPNWLRELIEIGESEKQVGILGAVQLEYEGGDFNGWTRTALAAHLAELSAPEEARRWIPVEWVEGACLAVKRQVIAEIGALDPIYFAFYEEIDFCRRATLRGWKVALVPRSRIHHFRGGSWEANARIKRERDYRCDRSQFIFTLTEPRRSLTANFGWYLVTLGTKGKEALREASLARLWDLARMQLNLAGQLGPALKKWRRERRNYQDGRGRPRPYTW